MLSAEVENKLVLILCLKEGGSLITELDIHSLFRSERLFQQGQMSLKMLACISAWPCLPMHCLGEGWRNLLIRCSLADSSRVTTGWLAWEFSWWFSVPMETPIPSFWDFVSQLPLSSPPHCSSARFLPALLSVQTCQHFVTDGCLSTCTPQSLNISRGLQEILRTSLRQAGCTVKHRLGRTVTALGSLGRKPWRWRRTPRANC